MWLLESEDMHEENLLSELLSVSLLIALSDPIRQ